MRMTWPTSRKATYVRSCGDPDRSLLSSVDEEMAPPRTETATRIRWLDHGHIAFGTSRHRHPARTRCRIP
ncbi:hypothetical protein GCM10018966_077950 [Streptomyces yanii]